MTKVKVEGLEELERNIAKLEKLTSSKVLRMSLKEIAAPIMQDIKGRLGQHKKTGSLANSGRISTSTARSQGKGFSAKARIIFGGNSTKTRSQATHAATQEFGSKNGKREARPAIKPGFDAGVNGAIDGFADAMKKQISKVGKSVKRVKK